jgi:hypothetical protein
MKRCFVFGCSYTHYSYATWADLIGINFNEYYNYGRSGCSNTYIMNRVIEANNTYSFNPDTDYVLVMLTGFGRFSYLPTNSIWQTKGDLHSYNYNSNDPVTIEFVKNMWSDDWAVYQSWIAAKVIKQTLKDVKHSIVMGINNSAYIDGTANVSDPIKPMANEIYNMLDIDITLDEWKTKNQYDDSPYWEDIQHNDGHPSTNVYLKYIEEFFPRFNTTKTRKFVNRWNKNFDHSSQHIMGQKFTNEFRKKSDLAFINNILNG